MATAAQPARRACRDRWHLAVGACLAALFVLLGCAANPAPHAAPPAAGQQAKADSPAAAERDEIYALLAYAVVQRQWQEAGTRDRGYNIGSVLVDPKGCVVYWGLNSVYLTSNKTQHGEVRLMTCYLERKREAGNRVPGDNLKDFSVYTTLEPCAMCSGMMVLQSVALTVYGQKDPSYGDALERLAFDGDHCGGYPPYPRPVKSVASTLAQRGQIETRFKEYCAQKPPPCSITDFLATPAAKQVYDDALAAFKGYRPRFPENKPVLAAALRFYDAYVPVTPKISCPELPPPSCPPPGASTPGR